MLFTTVNQKIYAKHKIYTYCLFSFLITMQCESQKLKLQMKIYFINLKNECLTRSVTALTFFHQIERSDRKGI